MATIQDVIRGAIKIDNLPDRECINSWFDLLLSLPTTLAVEVPASVSNVIVGNQSPGEDDTQKLWIRRTPSGAFLGFYLFQNGAWRPIFAVPPSQVVWAWGNSSVDVPDGFILIQPGDTQVPPSTVSHIVSQYETISPGVYAYFAMRYIGF